MSDVEELVALTGTAAAAAEPNSSEDEAAALVAMGGMGGTPNPSGAQDDSDTEDVLGIVAAATAKRKYVNRSWEHASHARSGKKLKAVQQQCHQLEQRQRAMARALSCAAHPPHPRDRGRCWLWGRG